MEDVLYRLIDNHLDNGALKLLETLKEIPDCTRMVFFAINRNAVHVAMRLLDHENLDLTHTDEFGNTLFHVTAGSRKMRPVFAKLCTLTFDPMLLMIKDRRGMTAMDLAILHDIDTSVALILRLAPESVFASPRVPHIYSICKWGTRETITLLFATCKHDPRFREIVNTTYKLDPSCPGETCMDLTHQKGCENLEN